MVGQDGGVKDGQAGVEALRWAARYVRSHKGSADQIVARKLEFIAEQLEAEAIDSAEWGPEKVERGATPLEVDPRIYEVVSAATAIREAPLLQRASPAANRVFVRLCRALDALPTLVTRPEDEISRSGWNAAIDRACEEIEARGWAPEIHHRIAALRVGEGETVILPGSSKKR